MEYKYWMSLWQISNIKAILDVTKSLTWATLSFYILDGEQFLHAKWKDYVAKVVTLMNEKQKSSMTGHIGNNYQTKPFKILNEKVGRLHENPQKYLN